MTVYVRISLRSFRKEYVLWAGILKHEEISKHNVEIDSAWHVEINTPQHVEINRQWYAEIYLGRQSMILPTWRPKATLSLIGALL